MTFRSPLNPEHRRLGAKLTGFAGWDMPLQYSGVIAEHMAVRERVGLFDVSHLGKLLIEGSAAVSCLDRLLPGKLPSEWKAAYNLVLDENAGIVDDVFVYRRPEGFIIVPNAANTAGVSARAKQEAGTRASVMDARDRWAIIALQGPSARDLMERLCPAAVALKLHEFGDVEVAGIPAQAARTGYTGEYGFELFVESDRARELWRKLITGGEDLGIAPCGLGARDTLRLEMGYPLHGHEISAETNPLESGLGWLIDWEKTSFVGKQRLEELRRSGSSRKLIGLVARDRGIPRAGYSVLRGGQKVGGVTSGNFSPVLGKGIALAYVTPESSAEGTMLEVDVRGKPLAVEVVTPPFVRRGALLG